MSQPPPPPNQPPPGGFGAPQDPPPGSEGGQPGGYGYPQPPAGPPGQPPAQPPNQPPGKSPGYGYPQQPPGMPTGGPAGGFGAPTPPPPGGFGPQPPGQPPGGYPTMPPQPGGGGRNNSKLIAIISAVVAVVLVAGAGVFLLTQGDDGGEENKQSKGGGDSNSQDDGGGGGAEKPDSTDGKLVAKMPAPKVEDQVAIPGAWGTDKAFVKTSTESVIAINAETGSQAWEIPLDGELCGASQHQTKDHKTAVVSRETKSSAADCNQMVLIDMKTGKKVWQKKVPGDNPDPENITISQGTVASAWIGGSVGYRIDGGERVWAAESSVNNDCEDHGYAGGEKLVAVLKCGDYGKEEFKVQELDPKTGKSTKTYKVASGVETVRVASTSPIVLVVGAGESTPTDIMTLSGDKFSPKISLDGDRYNTPCDTDVESCYGMTVGKDQVYLSTKPHSGSKMGSRTNEVMAIDLSTGDTTWKSDAGEDRSIVPVQMDGETVIAYKLSDYTKPGQIVGLDPKTGKQTTYLNLPKSGLDYEKEYGPSSTSTRGEVVFEHGKLMLSDMYVTKDGGTFTDERLLGVGYTAR